MPKTHHWANTRDRPCSCSMRNVAGACHTHCLHLCVHAEGKRLEFQTQYLTSSHSSCACVHGVFAWSTISSSCTYPMHVNSSTKTARFSFGSSFFALPGCLEGIHLLRGCPAMQERERGGERERLQAHVAREESLPPSFALHASLLGTLSLKPKGK